MGLQKRLFRWTALAALLLVWALTSALCEDSAGEIGALTIDFTIQPQILVAPGDVTMTFVLDNPTRRDVQNIYLNSSDGLLSEPIGLLRAGEKQTLVRPHTVTQEELDAGEIVYTISHDPLQRDGEKVVYTLTAAVTKAEQVPGVSFTRQMSSRFVPAGGQVTVTYKITNTGNVPLNTLRIRDALGDFNGRLEQLEVGEAKTFISRVTLESEAESIPALEYAVPSGKEYVLNLDPAPIGIADTGLEVAFSVGQSVFSEDTVDAILILSNSGDVDYTNLTVTDDVYGGVIADVLYLPAGGKNVEVTYTYPLRGDGEYRWRITGANGAGQRLDRLTDTVTVEDFHAGGSADISLTASTDTPRIRRAGRVTFDFAIANAGTAMARDARLYEVNRGDIRRLAVLPVGEPTRFSASYDVSADAEFIFCLAYSDAQGRQHTQTSAPIAVTIAADGADPVQTEEASAAFRGPSLRLGGNSTMFVALLIIAGAALTVMITILAVTSIRNRQERMKRVAAEKQRIKAELGRTGTFPAVKAPEKRKKG